MPTAPSPMTTTWPAMPGTLPRPSDCSMRRDTKMLVNRAKAVDTSETPITIRAMP